MPSNPRSAPNGFVFRDGEPVNKFAWLGIAPLVRAKRFPRPSLPYLPALDITDVAQLRHALEIIYYDVGLTSGLWPNGWRRVLLPMLLDEAKKRGIDV